MVFQFQARAKLEEEGLDWSLKESEIKRKIVDKVHELEKESPTKQPPPQNKQKKKEKSVYSNFYYYNKIKSF